MTSVPELIRAHRRLAGLSQRALAARAGTSASAVNRYEAGLVEPSITTLRRLVEACDAQLQLIAVPGDPDPVIADEVRRSRMRPVELRLRDLTEVDALR